MRWLRRHAVSIALSVALAGLWLWMLLVLSAAPTHPATFDPAEPATSEQQETR